MSTDYSTYTVEQLFQKLNVKEIQQINYQYQQDEQNAKQQLQQLVSTKYRDLISITDGIDEKCKSLHTNLADLAFKPARFMEFNSSLDTVLNRQIEKLKSGQLSRLVNDIMYGTLLKFDLLIQSSTPFTHSSSYIYYAKLYYAVESNFTPNQMFFDMKSRFLSFLIGKISSYNVSSRTIYQESDRYDAQDFFSRENVVRDSLVTGVPDCQDPDELLELYNINTLPIINYLVAYTILTCQGSVSKSNLLFDILEFRSKYLQQCLKGTEVNSETYNKISFFSIFEFIENTFNYVSDYLEDTDFKNAFSTQLHNSTKSWNLGDLTRLYKEPKLNVDSMSIRLPSSSLKDLEEFKMKFLDTGLAVFDNLVNNTSGDISSLNQNLTVFSNALVDLKKLQSECDEMGFKSQVGTWVSDKPVLNEVMHKVLKSAEILYTNHLSSLTEGLSTKINDKLPDCGSNEYKIFTSDFVGLINDDLTSYFDLITEASLDQTFSFTSSHEEPTKIVNNWFVNNSGYSILNGSFLDALLEKLFTNESASWNSFDETSVKKAFNELSGSLELQFWLAIELFITEISRLTDSAIDSKDISRTYSLTKLFIMLQQNITNSRSESRTKYLNSIHGKLVECYDFIIDQIPNINDDSVSFMDQFEAVISSMVNSPTPSGASPKLTTLMFHVSRKFLSPKGSSHELDYHNGILFIDETDSLFRETKNKWVDGLITKLLASLDEREEKLSVDAAYSIYANMVYLGCFSGKTIDIAHIQKHCEEELNVEDLRQEVIDTYTSSKGAYYPLNA